MRQVNVDGLSWDVSFSYSIEVNNYGDSPFFTAHAVVSKLHTTGIEYGKAFVVVNRIKIGQCEISRRIDERPNRYGDNSKEWRYESEYIRRWAENGIDRVLAAPPTDAVKSFLRKSAEKAITTAAEQIGDKKWKLDAKRTYWQGRYDRQMSAIIQARKMLAYIEDELRQLGVENAPD